MNNELQRIVLTGGPAAGKTQTIEALQEDREFRESVEFVPEVARQLIDGGYPMPSEDYPWTQEWQNRFQGAILPLQYALEDYHMDRARQTGKTVLLCDRGMMDGVAFMDGGLHEFLTTFQHQVSIEDMRSRYDHAIHLESLASYDPQLYETYDRMEDVETAAAIDRKIRGGWEQVCRYHTISGATSFEAKLTQVKGLLGSLMLDAHRERARTQTSALGDEVDDETTDWPETFDRWGEERQRNWMLRNLSNQELERHCLIPEGWAQWGGDPDTDPDTWDMPERWYE